MAKYLVTGGAGFIGSHLVQALCARGESVVAVDNLSTGKRKNIEPYLSKVSFIEGSLTELEVCRNAVEGVDYVLHEAALPSVPRSIADPLASHASNVTATLNLLVAARDAGVRRFVYAGSSSVYGNTATLPQVETMPPNPISPYAASKLAGEMYCCLFQRLYGLPIVGLRYFNVFGPRQDPHSQYAGVIPKFLTLLKKDEPITICGAGEQSRDFTHVDNVVEANLLACDAADAATGHVYNCACGQRTTVNQLASMLKSITGSASEIRYEAARAGDLSHSCADISKIREHLGYTPRVQLREGLERLVAEGIAD